VREFVVATLGGEDGLLVAVPLVTAGRVL